MTENEIAIGVIGSAIQGNKNLAPVLLESAYEECLFYEIGKTVLHVVKQKALPLVYDEIKLEVGYRIDILVENKL